VVGLEQRGPGLSKKHLQDAMSKLKLPIKFRQSDKMEVLIKNIIESTSTRDVAPRLEIGAQVLRAAGTTEVDIAAVNTERKRRVKVQKTSALLLHRTVRLEGENSVAGAHSGRPTSDEETGACDSQHLAQLCFECSRCLPEGHKGACCICQDDKRRVQGKRIAFLQVRRHPQQGAVCGEHCQVQTQWRDDCTRAVIMAHGECRQMKHGRIGRSKITPDVLVWHVLALP